ncbi:MmcQ/YjbR family DNA-binding protein [Nocardia paucivorans]|uniref:MmcQ/YjbR family DNA-binding protein n=1 Tax=Nocardia paucivorans TaxID=114259 RepID=UPI0005935C8F|nr:MmcQ/YjbR family DNA-binding protein [Nocardia paucivorans]
MSATGDDVRSYALSLPETTEQFTWGMPTFRVAGKLFLTLPEDETSMAVRCPIVDRDELEAIVVDSWQQAAPRRLLEDAG